VLTAGTATDPDSGQPYEDWTAPTVRPVGNVLVERLIPQELLDVRDAVTTRITLYFQGDSGAGITAQNRITLRGKTYDVFGEPGEWRMGRTFGYTVDVVDLLAGRRAAAEALMVDTCRVEHPTGSTVDAAGRETFTYDETYVGKCRVRLRGAGGAALREVGDQQISLLSLEIEVPVPGTEGIQVGDRVTLLRATNDSDLLGREFRVQQAAPETDAAQRLLQCAQVTG
jgi:hypothetical protein